MRALLAFTAALACAAPAWAFDLPPRALAQLAQGRAWIEVRPDADGVSGQIRAAIDIPAPQSLVWDLMTDCGLAPKFVVNLKSCRIVERDPLGLWDVREQVSSAPFLPNLRTVFRADYEPQARMRFHAVDGDLKVFEGEWRLEGHDGQVRVTYEARAAAPFSTPAWISRAVLRRDVPAALLALRREAVARIR